MGTSLGVLLMGCCGKKVVQVGNGIFGDTNLARGKKYEFADDRIRKCQKCNDNFWIGKRLFCLLRLRRFGRTLWPDPNAYVPALAAKKENECLRGNWE